MFVFVCGGLTMAVVVVACVSVTADSAMLCSTYTALVSDHKSVVIASCRTYTPANQPMTARTGRRRRVALRMAKRVVSFWLDTRAASERCWSKRG